MTGPTVKDSCLLHALEEAYLLILQMPHDMLRINNQGVLANVRDTIADTVKQTPEKVQTDFETEAFNLVQNAKKARQ